MVSLSSSSATGHIANSSAFASAFSSVHALAASSAFARSFASASAAASTRNRASASSSAFATNDVNVLSVPETPDTPYLDSNATIDVSPTSDVPSSNDFPVYVIAIICIALLVMTTTFLYFLCRCLARKKKRENQLATITPKVADPRMVGVRANQPIQFVVPTTIIVSENTEDSVSETDYSSGGAKNLPIILDKRRKRPVTGFHINPEDLQHGLYVGVNAASKEGAFLGDLGKVGFSLSYNLLRNQLTLKLIGATDLPCHFLKTTANPCAKIVLLPERAIKYMTKVQRNTMNPIFNETFTFSILRDELYEKKIKISVWDYDRFSRKCLIGQVVYPLKDSGLANVSAPEAVSGEIWIDLKQDSTSQSTSGNGEMLFSLCYNPDTANLSLNVLKVRGLSMQQGKELSVYAKITLYVRRKMARTRKTASKRKAPELEFNDTFNIHVPHNALGDVDLLVTLCEKAPGLGSKRVLGRTQVGGNCLCNQGLQHWQDMLMSPKSTCAQWHLLCG
ncbi:synaptotagmin-7-like [Uloborus diversus]|uniref:synaptotagmin-7-like n=1 Tax=Uloborus diversus TaxID=327109 RepID=UPI002409FEE1|nr:synaptotagmin-7-like [Uloborus diversus]